MRSYEYSGYPVHRISHQAMATIFEVHLLEERAIYASQAAAAVFHELDLIEQDLSRFLENSDITRINNLKTGESLVIGEYAFDCLKKSIDYYYKTDGVFNVGIGRAIRSWKQNISPTKNARLSEEGIASLELNENDFSVTLRGASLEVDLGGVGKGYAIDHMASVLREWDISDFLIHGGRSTSLARCTLLDGTGWQVSVSHPARQDQQLACLHLINNSLSGSGLLKGEHIINPRNFMPVSEWRAVWTLTAGALDSDILSTTFMIMNRSEIEIYVSRESEVSCLLLSGDDQIITFGEFSDPA